jgi:hypothetical protein
MASVNLKQVLCPRILLASSFPGSDPIQHQLVVVREAEEYLALPERIKSFYGADPL